MIQGPPSTNERPAKRKVRKGTHSCWQCRRRKVKCVFPTSEDVVCVYCRRHETVCEGQDVVSSMVPVIRNRQSTASIGRPGDVDGEVSERMSSLGTSTSTSPACTPASTLPSPLTNVSSRKRIREAEVNLLSPAPTTESEPAPAPVPVPDNPITANNFQDITRSLTQSFPCSKDIDLLLQKAADFATFDYTVSHPPNDCDPETITRRQISEANLLLPESHPVLLAGQMLRFGAAIQSILPTEQIPGLSEPRRIIMERVTKSAIKLVNTNDELWGSIEGLENTLLEAVYHINGGNIRRAWISMRRAVMVAQLLSLNRPNHHRFKILRPREGFNPMALWARIVYVERMLSLLLGLPTSTAGTYPSVLDPANSPIPNAELANLLMIIMEKVGARNHVHDPQEALKMTEEIDRELIRLSDNLPSSFWKPALQVDANDRIAVFRERRRDWEHLCYYTVVNQLHLPYMLGDTVSVSQQMYSRLACVTASRHVLVREISVRGFKPSTAACRMGDFMALVAGIALMLAHIVSHCPDQTVDDDGVGKGGRNMLVHQRLADRATVERALECMSSRAELSEDALAARCAGLLGELLDIENGAARVSREILSGTSKLCNDGLKEICKVLMIKVPYIGAIRIAREGVTTVTVDTEQYQEHGQGDKGVTVGGIGSIYVKSEKLATALIQQQHHHTDQFSGTSVESAYAGISGTSMPPLSDTVLPPTADVAMPHVEDLFPDPAAGIDDWVFQGFDTAFFDVLMRGSGDHAGNGNGQMNAWESSTGNPL